MSRAKPENRFEGSWTRRKPLSAGLALTLLVTSCTNEGAEIDGTAGTNTSPAGSHSGGAPNGGTGGSAGKSAVGGSMSGLGGTPGSAGTPSERAGSGGISGSSAGQGGSPSSQGGSASGGGGASAGQASSTAGQAGSGTPSGGSGGGTTTPSGSVPTSCKESGPGLDTCGKSGNDDCCASLPVAGGTYYRTYQNKSGSISGKADPATISTYNLDKYEVTVGRFRKFVEYLSKGGTPPAAGSGKHTHLNGGKGLADSGKMGSFESGWDAAWNNRIPSGEGAAAAWKGLLNKRGSGSSGCHIYGTWTDTPGKNESLPITCTSWYESYAFCIWDGGVLPSEAEWKYAAAGGDEHRAYPWGTTAPGSKNEYAIYDCCYPNGQCSVTSGRDTCTGTVNAAPVGYAEKGVGRYGQIDLIGNVWEWLIDRYSSYKSPCEDCAYLTGNTQNRVLPGSGFHTGSNLGSNLLYSWNRDSVSYDAETYRGDYAVGVRCARSP